VTAGTSYWIRISGFSGATGNFGVTLALEAAPVQNPGPDVTVFRVFDTGRYGTGTSTTGDAVTAYAIGTDSCNRGSEPVLWIDNNNRPGYSPTQHPVIAQNMFRYSVVGGAGRFEQIGQSWLKHGFLSLNSSDCGSCVTPPFGGDQLGVNCSDTYTASLNGNQGNLGPRSEVNATTGTFPWPHGTGTGGTVGMRLQVPTTSVTAPPAGSRFFADTHYVTADDAQYVAPGQTVAINGLNNASWREINIQGGTATPTFVGNTVQLQPGIHAWKAVDSTVTLVNADHDTPHPNQPGNFIRTRFIVGAKATAIAGGNWRYEYAIYNLNSDRSAGAFSVPVSDATAVSNLGFNHPKSHSGEPYSNAAWINTKANNFLTFSAPAEGANSNAIRWGTMYTVRFDSAAAPVTGTATISLFKAGQPGEANSVNVVGVPVPTPAPAGPVCTQNYNGVDGVNGDDLADYIADFFDSTGIQPGFAGPIAIPGGFAGNSTAAFAGFGFGCPTNPDVPQPNPWSAPVDAYRTSGYKVVVGQNNGPCAEPNGDDLADFIGLFFNGCP
jgi:hypothetical protein